MPGTAWNTPSICKPAWARQEWESSWNKLEAYQKMISECWLELVLLDSPWYEFEVPVLEFSTARLGLHLRYYCKCDPKTEAPYGGQRGPFVQSWKSKRVFVRTIDRFSSCNIWYVVQFFPAYRLDLIEQAKLLWWHQYIKLFRLIACDWSLDLCLLGKQYKCKKQESASQRDTRYHGVIWIYRWFAMDPSAGQVQVIEGDLEAMSKSLG